MIFECCQLGATGSKADNFAGKIRDAVDTGIFWHYYNEAIFHIRFCKKHIIEAGGSDGEVASDEIYVPEGVEFFEHIGSDDGFCLESYTHSIGDFLG